MQKIVNRVYMLAKRPSAKEVLRFQYAVTYRCNSRCTLCNIWRLYKEEPHLLEKELSLQRLKEKFSSINLPHIMQISFTGGEPFLRKDFPALYTFFAKKFPKSYIYIVTNALASSVIIDALSSMEKHTCLRRLRLGISLDGEECMHDKIRGVKGAYKAALATLEKVKEKFGNALSLEINFTIIPENLKQIFQVYRIAREYGAHFSARFAQTSSFYYHNEEMNFGWDQNSLKRAEEYLKKIAEKVRKDASFLRRIFSLDAYFLYHASLYQGLKRRVFECFSGTHSFFLDPYGHIFPCINLERCMGSLLEKSFNALWMSKEAENIRSFIRERRCFCWTECEVYPSLQRSIKPIIWNIKCLLFQ
jgi:MoaA/NifB/PqqE/SkfB family radical SAM enzyme